MAKKIIWSNNAEQELLSALEFYNLRNGSNSYSLKLLDKVDDVVNTISETETVGRLTKNKVTRVFPIDIFLLFYEVTHDSITIVSFWNNKQDQIKNRIK
jgi:toxin YoeB